MTMWQCTSGWHSRELSQRLGLATVDENSTRLAFEYFLDSSILLGHCTSDAVDSAKQLDQFIIVDVRAVVHDRDLYQLVTSI